LLDVGSTITQSFSDDSVNVSSIFAVHMQVYSGKKIGEIPIECFAPLQFFDENQESFVVEPSSEDFSQYLLEMAEASAEAHAQYLELVNSNFQEYLRAQEALAPVERKPSAAARRRSQLQDGLASRQSLRISIRRHRDRW
jgi:hypothetical protein